MTRQQEIERLRESIERSREACETWRKAGPEERYLEAYVTTKALELQLDEILRQPDR